MEDWKQLKNPILEELEFELIMCQKTGKAEYIPGLERAIELIAEL